MFGFFRKRREEQKPRKNSKPSIPELGKAAPRKNPANAAEIAASSETSSDSEKTMCDQPLQRPLLYVHDNHEMRRAGVKPCGHGTTAIAPWVPAVVQKQEKSAPPSPDAELRNPLKTGDEKPMQNGLIRCNEKGADDVEETKNLISQEAKFQSQLNDLSKQLSIRDAEANKLRFQLEDLQRDVFAKSAGMDRLQAELSSSTKESELIRNRIHNLENELERYRKENFELNDSLQCKTESFDNYERETKTKIEELEGMVKDLEKKTEVLEKELEQVKEEKEKLKEQHIELMAKKEEEKTKLKEILENALKQKQEIEQKWKEEFEKMRTINILKEQQVLDDFEWKLREVQQTCKKKLTDKEQELDSRLQEAYQHAEKKVKESEQFLTQLESLKSYRMEAQQLREKTQVQEKSLHELTEHQTQMKLAEENLKNEIKRLRNLIEMEKENLQHMQRIHQQELQDKERKLRETLNQKRTEIAMYWEERLLTECGRLKNELEQIHVEEKHAAMETARRQKDEDFQKIQNEWDKKLKDSLKEIKELRMSLEEKDEYYHDEIERTRSKADRDIMELRRIMDKIDMTHHNNYDNLLLKHEIEIDRINEEHGNQLKSTNLHWHSQVTALRNSLQQDREKLEKEAQQRIEALIEQHREELDAQWENLVHQKTEAIQLVEEEYVTKYKTLEEQFCTQQKSHEAREIELLKTIGTLKNELESKGSTIDDLQNNVDTLEGGIQVLNQEIAQHTDDLSKVQQESGQKIRNLHESLAKVLEEREKEREAFRLKLTSVQKQSQETIDHLQRKCQCLTKLFEEVRQRYERRDSRQEDLNKISDLKQIIAEQEKDLACLNEEKRFFQMRVMQLERHFDGQASTEEEEYEDAESAKLEVHADGHPEQRAPLPIPPTIPECDE